MHEIAAKALALAHDTFRCGVPHFRERRLIPIRTSAHQFVFDVDKVSPLYTMLEVRPTDKTNVEREDNFSSGDVTLPDELCTSEIHYANWNKAHPEFPVDKGHSAGSQYRRGDVVEQSDIDTLAGVTPEASLTNRSCKGPLESAILEYAKKNPHLPGARTSLVWFRTNSWEIRKRSMDPGCTLYFGIVSASEDCNVVGRADG